MDLRLRRSGGPNIVLRPQARPRWYAPATAPAATVDIWWRYASEAVQACRFLGNYPVNQIGSIPFNPDRDENVIFQLVSLSASGTPSVADLADAVQVELIFKRETEAPDIGQVGEATAESVEIGITRFTRFARQRRITIYADEALTQVIAVLLFNSDDYVARELPRYFILSRFLTSTLTTQPGEQAILVEGGESAGQSLTTEDEGAVLPASVWVTVAHSGGNGWTPESNTLGVTFAAGDGSGGSADTFDPTPRDAYRFDLGEV